MALHGLQMDRGLVSPLIRDTVLVAPMGSIVEIDAHMDNPGRWFLHGHHLYHMEAGMARAVEYR